LTSLRASYKIIVIDGEFFAIPQTNIDHGDGWLISDTATLPLLAFQKMGAWRISKEPQQTGHLNKVIEEVVPKMTRRSTGVARNFD